MRTDKNLEALSLFFVIQSFRTGSITSGDTTANLRFEVHDRRAAHLDGMKSINDRSGRRAIG
ncbi:MAG: hypothetical protein ABSA46_07780 [Thermodesulfovibrionales bacterium]